MSTETAYRTADEAVVEAYIKYQATAVAVAEKRRAVSEAVGRNLYVNRLGFGHGTRVVGFERFDSDSDGDLVHHDGCLIVSSGRGQHHGLVVPNMRRKAGKEMYNELAALTTPVLDLPGMPGFHIGGTGYGIASFAPALWFWNGVMYALWGCNNVPVGDNWESIPLSTYYLAREQYEREHPEEGSDHE